MKNLITAIFVCISTLVFAQKEKEMFEIKKGTWSIEGSFSIGTSEFEEYYYSGYTQDNFNFSLTSKVGYSINKNLILGLGIGYGYSKSESDDNYHSESNAIHVFPYIKKFIPLGEKLALHLQAETQFSNSKHTMKSYGSKTDYDFNMFFIGIKPGVSYFVSKNILLQANFGAFGYSTSKRKEDGVDDEKITSFGLILDSSNLTFGFVFLF